MMKIYVETSEINDTLGYIDAYISNLNTRIQDNDITIEIIKIFVEDHLHTIKITGDETLITPLARFFKASIVIVI